MLAFANPVQVPARALFSRTHTCRQNGRRHLVATLSPADDELRVRFNRGEDDTKRSFLPEPTKPVNQASPNERALAQVRDTMQRLGVQENPEDIPKPRPFRPIDVSRVNPLSAFAGAAGAAGISYAAWIALAFIANFFVTHPFTDEIYVVQRIGAVVRTVLVCLFALGSGISGVTGLGLFLLGIRTTFGKVTGEFRDGDN